MTDYKNLKLRASSNPHIRNGEDTRGLMLDVIIALMPALLFGVWHFGVRVAISAVVSVASAIFFEWLYRNILKKPQSVGDLSAVVTGMLLAFVCPVNVAYWQILIGDAFAIIMVKQLFGGIGKNFLNPALAGRAFMLASFASTMSGNWIDPAVSKAGIASTADIVTAATPLTYLKGDDIAATFQTLTETYSVGDMFLGKCGGSLGEVSALCLLLGLVWLRATTGIRWTDIFCAPSAVFRSDVARIVSWGIAVFLLLLLLGTVRSFRDQVLPWEKRNIGKYAGLWVLYLAGRWAVNRFLFAAWAMKVFPSGNYSQSTVVAYSVAGTLWEVLLLVTLALLLVKTAALLRGRKAGKIAS